MLGKLGIFSYPQPSVVQRSSLSLPNQNASSFVVIAPMNPAWISNAARHFLAGYGWHFPGSDVVLAVSASDCRFVWCVWRGSKGAQGELSMPAFTVSWVQELQDDNTWPTCTIILSTSSHILEDLRSYTYIHLISSCISYTCSRSAKLQSNFAAKRTPAVKKNVKNWRSSGISARPPCASLQQVGVSIVTGVPDGLFHGKSIYKRMI